MCIIAHVSVRLLSIVKKNTTYPMLQNVLLQISCCLRSLYLFSIVSVLQYTQNVACFSKNDKSIPGKALCVEGWEWTCSGSLLRLAAPRCPGSVAGVCPLSCHCSNLICAFASQFKWCKTFPWPHVCPGLTLRYLQCFFTWIAFGLDWKQDTRMLSARTLKDSPIPFE